MLEELENDIKQYKEILAEYDLLQTEDIETAYELSKKFILMADRWNEIAFNSSKYSKEYNQSKTTFYQWAYHKYRVLMTLHEFCRVIYKQGSDNLRMRTEA